MIQKFKDFLSKRNNKPNLLGEQYPQYKIGKWTYGNLRVISWGEQSTLIMGAFCSIGGSASVILGGEHRIDWLTTYPFSVLWDLESEFPGHPATKGNVEIGNDVWVGTGAVIFSGVKIGDGAVIGARAVVTKDVPPYGIVVGNPATLKKKRFDEPTIERLLKIAWWNWDDTKIRQFMPLMLQTDIEKFLIEAEKDINNPA